jgi:hypothetical protein
LKDKGPSSPQGPFARLTNKIHVVVDANALPMQLGLTPARLTKIGSARIYWRDLQPQSMLLADREYDADWIRTLVNQQGA